MSSRLPSVFRVLFTEDEYVNSFSSSRIHEVTLYIRQEGEMESDTEYSPRSSPLRDPVTPPRARKPESNDSDTTLVNSGLESATHIGASPVRVVPDEPCGLVRFQHITRDLRQNQAMQEISCEYSKLHKIYIQYIQFSMGGVAAPEITGTVSPRAVFRTWPEGSLDPEPFWVKYHKFGYALRAVSVDFAIGRVALLACCNENMCISRDLLNWAEKFNPLALALPEAGLQWLSTPTSEDSPE
ncbi:hypothetical protein DFH09DRAFT_1308305 [Mycena vulgaris]|nr:hypothetical protein DFH09DRAFT_1308305 [Mycena vulgaris]